MLIGSAQGVFSETPAGLRIYTSIFEGITAAQKDHWDAIYAVLASIPHPRKQAIEALHSVCPQARIVLLVQMAEELQARELLDRFGWPSDWLNYCICPVSSRCLTAQTPASDDYRMTSDDKDRRIRELEKLVMQDDLTGLKNRRYLRHFLPTILQKADLSHSQITVLLFDLDDFKHYNDTYGHAVGDEVLRQTARLIRRCCRSQDVVARLGGDEFAVVFWDASDAEHHSSRKTPEERRKSSQNHPREPVFMAERMRREISAAAFDQLGSKGKGALTISGGLASYPGDGRTAEELLEKADQAMLEAKRCGKNRVLLVGQSA